jgi:hypothetical protein
MYAQITVCPDHPAHPRPCAAAGGPRARRPGILPQTATGPRFRRVLPHRRGRRQNTAIVLRQDRGQAEAFQAQQQAWSDTVEEMGSRRDSGTAGKVITHVTP